MELNADFSRRVAAHAARPAWVASPIAGVDRRMLDRIGDEMARATSIVRYAPASSFSAHTHGGGEEFLVLELQLGEAPVDIVAKEFDAGVGPQDRVAADMVIVRVMRPMKVAVVGAPAYFSKRGGPRSPDHLARHGCVQYRRSTDGAVFAWPFERNGKSRKISVDGRVMVNAPDLAVRAAVDGLGIAYTIEALAEPFLRSGQLIRVLENWSPSFEGLFLYYPSHRQVSALRALIDMIRETCGSATAKGVVENPCTAKGGASAVWP